MKRNRRGRPVKVIQLVSLLACQGDSVKRPKGENDIELFKDVPHFLTTEYAKYFVDNTYCFQYDN
jgi:hypothetical protein